MEIISMTFEDIVKKIRALPIEKRKELITVIVDSLTQPEVVVEPENRAVVGSDGSSPEIWQGADLQNNHNPLHIEWTDRV
jgi:hypothetical protein